jgi:heme-degrading monooxygenase HmoA
VGRGKGEGKNGVRAVYRKSGYDTKSVSSKWGRAIDSKSWEKHRKKRETKRGAEKSGRAIDKIHKIHKIHKKGYNNRKRRHRKGARRPG